MNNKVAKRLRRTSKFMAIEFLKPLMPAAEAVTLDLDKLKAFEADQGYVWHQDGYRILPAFSSRRTYKNLKKAYYGRAYKTNK